MAFYVINQTTLQVRVVAERDKNEDRVVIILVLPGGGKPKFRLLLDATVAKNIHPKVLVPGVLDKTRVSVNNRANVATELVKAKNGDMHLYIKSVLN